MTATLAPSSWSMPPDSRRSATWRFGREVLIGEGAGATQALQWRQGRNCSITPRQLGAVYASLCLVSLFIAVGFFSQGVRLVLAFAGIELLAVGAALLVYARHAADRETLTLVGRALHVEQCSGSRVQRTDFAADRLTVEPAAGQGSLVELSGRGQSVRVGRFLRPELRAAYARELRLALCRAPACPVLPAADQTAKN
jgi:uncharacterized membrane protein